MKKKIILILFILMILITGCVDKSKAMQVCHDKGFQYTGNTFGSDIKCINTTSGEIHTYKGSRKVVIEWKR